MSKGKFSILGHQRDIEYKNRLERPSRFTQEADQFHNYDEPKISDPEGQKPFASFLGLTNVEEICTGIFKRVEELSQSMESTHRYIKSEGFDNFIPVGEPSVVVFIISINFEEANWK